MKLTRIALSLGLVALPLSGAALPATGAGTSAPSAADTAGHQEFIVKFKSAETASVARATTLQSVTATTGVKSEPVRELALGNTLVRVDKPLSGKAEQDYLAKLSKRSDVEFAVPNGRVKAFGTASDPDYPKLWDRWFPNGGMNVHRAWDIAKGSGAVIGVIDGGRINTPDVEWLPGYDFVSDKTRARDGDGRDANAQDEGDWNAAGECGGSLAHDSSWHGTHVAGTTAAKANNTGVVGVAPEAKVVPVRTMAQCGGADADVLDSMAWAAGLSVPGAPMNPNPVDVMNLSLGSEKPCNEAYQSTINRVRAAGSTIVVASGNSKKDATGFQPSGCQGVISVGALDMHGNMSAYSNWGKPIDIMAPGGEGDPLEKTKSEQIWSVVDRGKTTPQGPTTDGMVGTSMASPQIAGLVALIKSVNKSLTPDQVEQIIKDTARPMPGTCTQPNMCGAGVADAFAAVAKAKGVTTSGTANVVNNGGFESGTSGWNVTGTNAIVGGGKTGQAIKLLGVGKTGAATLSRNISVPNGPGNAYIGYWVKVDSGELTDTVARDTMIITAGGFPVKMSNLDKTANFAPGFIDVTAYKGRSVELKFDAKEDSWGQTGFFIDDVSAFLYNGGTGGSNPGPGPTDPPKGDLQNGVPVSFDLEKGTQKRFSFPAPAGVSSLKVELSGSNGDADLYVGVDSAPTDEKFTCRPYLSGSNESCTISNPRGTIHVMVNGYEASPGLSLVVKY